MTRSFFCRRIYYMYMTLFFFVVHFFGNKPKPLAPNSSLLCLIILLNLLYVCAVLRKEASLDMKSHVVSVAIKNNKTGQFFIYIYINWWVLFRRPSPYSPFPFTLVSCSTTLPSSRRSEWKRFPCLSCNAAGSLVGSHPPKVSL